MFCALVLQIRGEDVDSTSRYVPLMVSCVMGGIHGDGDGMLHASALGEFMVWLGNCGSHISNEK